MTEHELATFAETIIAAILGTRRVDGSAYPPPPDTPERDRSETHQRRGHHLPAPRT